MTVCKIETEPSLLTKTKKRRLRRKKLQSLFKKDSLNKSDNKPKETQNSGFKCLEKSYVQSTIVGNNIKGILEMSSKENSSKSREEVLAAREAKKLAKLKVKNKTTNEVKDESLIKETKKANSNIKKDDSIVEKEKTIKRNEDIDVTSNKVPSTSQDEVDRVISTNVQVKISPNTEIKEENKDRELVKNERAAKKAAKQAKKKNVDSNVQPSESTSEQDEINKSKTNLRAERRAKQEAQRAAKQAAVEQKPAKAKPQPKSEVNMIKPKEDKPIKQRTLEKSKAKSQNGPRVKWFQHLYSGYDKESLRKIPINSNLHPAIIKLGVQLASRVVKGSNARCIALLDALKTMVRDYTLPAKTEFARGLEAHLATSLDFLWSMRQPSASQTNAIKFFRHHLTQLPNNIDEFSAKKTLQEEIHRYIKEQIDVAGEAISIAVRNKISKGDHILTYGCSSLIERILVDAWKAGVEFRTVVVGNRVQTDAREMLRRLSARGLPCTYIDITSLSFLINTIDKVVLGASALLVNGSVLGAGGTAQVAVVARSANVPVLVACETHKFSERVQTDAFVYNEIGDPDDLIDKSDDNSPLKDWRSNPNLTPLNLLYDVTPPSLVTAVVTELAILPCTSVPVVLRFKLSEYGI